MRTGQPIISRPAWYDRNPKSICVGFSGALAPHSTTIRWTYTCPAGKRAMIELLQCSVRRVTAASMPNDFFSGILFTPIVGDEGIILIAYITSAETAVGAKELNMLGGNLMLQPGDEIKGYTGDFSTGGTVFYVLNYKLTEFDA